MLGKQGLRVAQGVQALANKSNSVRLRDLARRHDQLWRLTQREETFAPLERMGSCLQEAEQIERRLALARRADAQLTTLLGDLEQATQQLELCDVRQPIALQAVQLRVTQAQDRLALLAQSIEN
jgi:hypothetical protein